jgi:hypothetical protein
MPTTGRWDGGPSVPSMGGTVPLRRTLTLPMLTGGSSATPARIVFGATRTSKRWVAVPGPVNSVSPEISSVKVGDPELVAIDAIAAVMRTAIDARRRSMFNVAWATISGAG